MKNIYNIIEFDNPKGFGYYFNVTHNCRYTLIFSYLGNNRYLFEFGKTENSDKQAINYKQVRNSVCKVIYNFIKTNYERVVFMVYDNENKSDKIRFRLFNNWFNHYNNKGEFKKLDFLTSKNEIVSIIFKHTNMKFINEIALKD